MFVFCLLDVNRTKKKSGLYATVLDVFVIEKSEGRKKIVKTEMCIV